MFRRRSTESSNCARPSCGRFSVGKHSENLGGRVIKSLKKLMKANGFFFRSINLKGQITLKNNRSRCVLKRIAIIITYDRHPDKALY